MIQPDKLHELWDDPNVPVILRSTKTSPYGRKVRMALEFLDLTDRVDLISADTLDEADDLRQQNPLGKMPCLLINGEAFFDSHVILELLDALAGGGKLLPSAGIERFETLTRARLADGVTDAALLITYESRFRKPEQVSERWLNHQLGKIRRGLRSFETAPPEASKFDLTSLTLSASLNYLDWRETLQWRSEFPQLAQWLENFALAHHPWQTTQLVEA